MVNIYKNNPQMQICLLRKKKLYYNLKKKVLQKYRLVGEFGAFWGVLFICLLGFCENNSFECPNYHFGRQ